MYGICALHLHITWTQYIDATNTENHMDGNIGQLIATDGATCHQIFIYITTADNFSEKMGIVKRKMMNIC